MTIFFALFLSSMVLQESVGKMDEQSRRETIVNSVRSMVERIPEEIVVCVPLQ